MTRPTARIALALTFLTTLACGSDGGSGSGGMTQIDPPSLTVPGGQSDLGDTGLADDTGSPADCTATELCERSIDDCGVNLDLPTCEAWYADAGSCRDMDAYLACNCDCEASEDTCDGYFACGEFCFAAHCE